MPDDRFGNCRVASVLGAGALSTIYKAVQEPIGRVVAVKALKNEIAPTSSFGEQLDREASVLRDLAHPNVVLLFDAGRTAEGRPFVALEYIEGPSLHQWLQKKRALSVEVALAVGMGICAALEHIHERGVVHRDVKPSNVLLTRTGVVKLIDFGIAQRTFHRSPSEAIDAEGITPSGRMAPEVAKDAFGTPAYMSPEQILGDFVDGRSDLFSLGVVLYEMLSGTRPFESPSAGVERTSRALADRSASSRMRREAPARLSERAPHVPRPVSRLVMRLLEKAPAERHSSASEVLEHLRRELRALTRETPPAVILRALAEAGFFARPAEGTTILRPRKELPLARVLAGQGLVLLAFSVGVLAIEGGSFGRSRGDAPDRSSEPLAERSGGLRVLATPWARVLVDGRQVETTPFARAISLSPGKHWVTLTHPEAPPLEREIDVIPNETVTLDVTMSLSGPVD